VTALFTCPRCAEDDICGTCESRAEAAPDARDNDYYGWAADMAADRAERHQDNRWSTS